MYKYTFRHIEIKTYRHALTNRQTEDSAKSAGTGWKTGRWTERPIFTLAVHTYRVLYIRQTCRQTDRQTDRTDRKKKWHIDQQTHRQTIYECWVKMRSKLARLRESATRTPASTNRPPPSIPKKGTSDF
jgi:hypothetical protein